LTWAVIHGLNAMGTPASDGVIELAYWTISIVRGWF
jgi:hypothetical protein